MNILLVTNNVPYPPTDGWKIRVFAFIRHLAVRHQVSVVSFMRTTEDERILDALRSYCRRLEVVPRSPRYSAWKLVRGVYGATPFSVLNYDDPRMHAAVRRVLDQQAFDVVQAESLQVAQYCLGAPALTVLDLHNIESRLMLRYAAQARDPLKRWYARVTGRKLWEYERRTYSLVDGCLVCSEEDGRVALEQAPAARITVVANGVELPDAAPAGLAAQTVPPRLVFVGRMDYHANVEGITWFCRDVLPAIRAVRPDVSLQIVGGHPTVEVRRLARPGVVEVTGFVEDPVPYVRGAAAIVVPLRVGGGTRLKLLEALALSKAVVSTPVGAEGIRVTHGCDVLLAPDAPRFADAVLAVLADPQLARRLGQAGRRLVQERYMWPRLVERLERFYLARLQARRGPEGRPARAYTAGADAAGLQRGAR